MVSDFFKKIILVFLCFSFLISPFGNVVAYSAPDEISAQENPNNNGTQKTNGAKDLMNLAKCDVFWGEGNWGGCIALFSYTIYELSSFAVSISASIFNGFLSFTLDKNIINQGFVITGWNALRNIANMLFIVVLIAIAISIMLGFGKYNSQGMVVNVIIVALILNFSLFVAKVIIDAGNIVALGFYDAIQAPTTQGGLSFTEKITSATSGAVVSKTTEKDLSGKIMEGFNPARMMSPKSFELWKNAYIDKGGSDSGANTALAGLFIVALLLNFYTAYLFLMAGFLFFERVANLWMIMILGPLAFMGFAVPDFQKLWSWWWSNLFDKAFCIVPFMFFIWMTLLITGDESFKSVFTASIDQESSFLKMISLLVLQAAIVLGLLQKSLKYTQSMCGEGTISKFAGGYLNKGLDVAKGVALGGFGAASIAKFAAKQSLGGLAQRGAEKMEKSGMGTTKMGRMGLTALRNVGDYKFGTKEGYKTQRENVAKQHIDYSKTLPKSVKNKNGITTNPRQEYLDNLEKQSLLANSYSFVTGQRAGEEKIKKDAGAKTEKDVKIEEIRKGELTDARSESDNAKKLLKDLRDTNVDPEEIKEQTRKVLEAEEKVRKAEEKIKQIRES